MNKFKARVLITAALFVGAILAFLCIEHFRGEFALNSRLKQLAANRETLDYKELLPPKPAPEQNAALELFALTNDLKPFSVNGSTVLRPQEVETEKNLIITAIALKRHELRHGKPATTLADLVPEFLAAVPLDRMDGKPLRYHRNADGTFKLYSIGLNCTDEGGDPEPEKPVEKFHNIWQGRDAVWPVAVAQ